MMKQRMRLTGLAVALAGLLVLPGLALGKDIDDAAPLRQPEAMSLSLAELGVQGISPSILPCFWSNDAFGCARPLLRSQERVQNTAFATLQAGEPQPCVPVSKTVWYKMVAYGLPVEFPDIRLTTAGSTFDTVLTVYQGTNLSNLKSWACDDDSGPGLTSEVRFTAAAGQTFYIQVGSYASSPGGELRLLWG